MLRKGAKDYRLTEKNAAEFIKQSSLGKQINPPTPLGAN